MDYPYHIWPQQIQGLDFHAIEILFRWLFDQITEIRNSLPRYESIAAQQEFDEYFVFDISDCPSSSLWKYTPQIQVNPIDPSFEGVFISDCTFFFFSPS